MGSACFSVPLVLQGIAASSHGNPGFKFLFGNLSHDGVPVLAGDLNLTQVGTVYAAQVFDGAFNP